MLKILAQLLSAAFPCFSCSTSTLLALDQDYGTRLIYPQIDLITGETTGQPSRRGESVTEKQPLESIENKIEFLHPGIYIRDHTRSCE